MGYINIFVSSYCRLSLEKGALLLTGDNSARFPLQDINSVMIDNLQCTISMKVLSELARENIAVYMCDERHLPCGIVLPFAQYYAPLKTYRMQSGIKKPLNKQMWQSIIVRKILNQAECLRLSGKDEAAAKLTNLAADVCSGDATNVEATAAREYFKSLFGKDFDRRSDNGINACLNYGYAIVRGLIARTLASRGMSVFLGIHHSNELNAFNLADDFIEPYRPIVDRLVFKCSFNKLDTESKKELFNLNNVDVLIDGTNQVLPRSIEICADSYMASLDQNINLLKLPIMQEVVGHEYL